MVTCLPRAPRSPPPASLFRGHLGGRLFRVDDDGEARLFAELEGPNGTAFHWNGDIYVVDPGGERIARVTPGGKVYTVATTCDGQPFEGTPNDITFHPTGDIFKAVMDRLAGRLERKVQNAIALETAPIARLDAALAAVLDAFTGHRRPVYRIDPAGEATKVIDGLQYPNGVNVNADGIQLYVAESCTGEIKICDIRPDGAAGCLVPAGSADMLPARHQQERADRGPNSAARHQNPGPHSRNQLELSPPDRPDPR